MVSMEMKCLVMVDADFVSVQAPTVRSDLKTLSRVARSFMKWGLKQAVEGVL